MSSFCVCNCIGSYFACIFVLVFSSVQYIVVLLQSCAKMSSLIGIHHFACCILLQSKYIASVLVCFPKCRERLCPEMTSSVFYEPSSVSPDSANQQATKQWQIVQICSALSSSLSSPKSSSAWKKSPFTSTRRSELVRETCRFSGSFRKNLSGGSSQHQATRSFHRVSVNA